MLSPGNTGLPLETGGRLRSVIVGLRMVLGHDGADHVCLVGDYLLRHTWLWLTGQVK